MYYEMRKFNKSKTKSVNKKVKECNEKLIKLHSTIKRNLTMSEKPDK